MKVSISYPPITSPKGIPLLSQNRQFQWFSHPTYIYPMVPAYAATLLSQAGYDVSWDDGIAEELTLSDYMGRMLKEKPDLIAIESKTPVIRTHWAIIDRIKQALPRTKVVLVGDHVTALPRESLEKCAADYVLTGGDYDFLLLNLCNHLTRSEKLEAGTWFKESGQ
ncbi:MAG: cobalamin-dependent protein, partial [Chloroflexi bacterium]|nr:cobalamin-dependent protein [Chloroflexota bacterium]